MQLMKPDGKNVQSEPKQRRQQPRQQQQELDLVIRLQRMPSGLHVKKD
jgi:hypothetical protein